MAKRIQGKLGMGKRVRLVRHSSSTLTTVPAVSTGHETFPSDTRMQAIAEEVHKVVQRLESLTARHTQQQPSPSWPPTSPSPSWPSSASWLPLPLRPSAADIGDGATARSRRSYAPPPHWSSSISRRLLELRSGAASGRRGAEALAEGRLMQMSGGADAAAEQGRIAALSAARPRARGKASWPVRAARQPALRLAVRARDRRQPAEPHTQEGETSKTGPPAYHRLPSQS